MFQAERVKDSVWPEGLGIAAYLAAELIAASIDSRLKLMNGYPVTQTAVTGVALAGGIAMVGYNVAPGFSKGLVYGSGVGLIANLVSGLYQAATKQSAKIRLSDVAALVPRRIGALPAGGGGAGGGGAALPPGANRVPANPQVPVVAASARATADYHG